MDYHTLQSMRAKHPAWRLLTADHSPFVASFLYVTFVLPNLQTLSASDLASRLDDFLYPLRSELGENSFLGEQSNILTIGPRMIAVGYGNTIRRTLTRPISILRR